MLKLRNTYYAGLPSAIQKKWKAHLSLREFNVGDHLTLDTGGGAICFPITCVAMIGIRAHGCRSTFLRFSSHSAVIGIGKIFHVSKIEIEAKICFGGYAFVMPAKVVSQYLEDVKLSAEWNSRYLSLLVEEVSISAYCAQSHDSLQRVARVLLEAFENLPSGDEVMLTQGELAHLVGVRREAVCADMARLSQAGIVSTTRGKIKIEQRECLATIACDCYRHSTQSRMTALDLWKTIPWQID